MCWVSVSLNKTFPSFLPSSFSLAMINTWKQTIPGFNNFQDMRYTYNT